ncbi:MAG: hypothetical protein WBQ20_13185 [Methyloceanibacter sp.]
MSDVEKEIDELQCKLTAKTREIETLVAEKLNLGDIDAMDGTAYDRLRTYVEELIEKWQRADVDHPGSNPANGSKCTSRRARGDRGANSHTASAMKESRQRSAVARASQNRWHESPFGSLFVSKGRTLDHRRSEQQQAPVAESLRLPPAKHGREVLK